MAKSKMVLKTCINAGEKMWVVWWRLQEYGHDTQGNWKPTGKWGDWLPYNGRGGIKAHDNPTSALRALVQIGYQVDTRNPSADGVYTSANGTREFRIVEYESGYLAPSAK